MEHQHQQRRQAAAQAFDESLNALEETFGADGDACRPVTVREASLPENRRASAHSTDRHAAPRTLEQAFQDAAADLETLYPTSPDA
jgi:hypothetical protein